MKQLSTEKTMTVKEVAEVLDLDPRTIQMKVKELFPEIIKKRQTTFLTESQVTAVKLGCEKKFAVHTDLEKELIIQQAAKFQQEKIDKLMAENAIMKPKAEFFDAVTDSRDTIDMSTAAKLLNKMGRNKLFEFLRDIGVFMHDNQPYQKYVDKGYFRVIEQGYEKPNGVTGINTKTLIYQSGLDFIRKKLKNN